MRKPSSKRKGKRRPVSEAIKAAADAAEARSRGETAAEPKVPIDPEIEKTASRSVVAAPTASPEAKPKHAGGRPPKYKKEYASQAKKLCALGATDSDLAEAFGVTTWTIWNWRSKHKEFSQALVVGKGTPDDRVERSLYQRAVGYSYNAVKIMSYEGESFEHAFIEHVPPDPNAAKLWLTNRRPENWRERQVLEHESADFRQFLEMMASGKFKPKPFDPNEDDNV